jgi:hypothetical protein
MYYDAATRYIRTIRAGEADYYQPRKRGTVTVAHDSKIYVYRFPPNCDRMAAKYALAAAFFYDGTLRGRWPEYVVV